MVVGFDFKKKGKFLESYTAAKQAWNSRFSPQYVGGITS